MILLIDNYDSFVYNLRRYLLRLGQQVSVQRNDEVDLTAIEAGQYLGIVISPGPQGPSQAGCCLEVVNKFASHIPIFGVCLGHQVICQAFGGNIVRAPRPVHGRASWIHHSDTGIFEQVPNPFLAARYHSLVAQADSIPSELRVTATADSDIVMAVEHIQWRTFGVQFHPESILTDSGYRLLMNFLAIAGAILPNVIPSSDLANSTGVSLAAASPEFRHGESSADELDCIPVVLPDYRQYSL